MKFSFWSFIFCFDGALSHTQSFAFFCWLLRCNNPFWYQLGKFYMLLVDCFFKIFKILLPYVSTNVSMVSAKKLVILSSVATSYTLAIYLCLNGSFICVIWAKCISFFRYMGLVSFGDCFRIRGRRAMRSKWYREAKSCNSCQQYFICIDSL